MKKLMTAAAVMILLSGCGQIDGYDVSVSDRDSGTFAVLQTADTTTTAAHTTRNLPETETSAAAILTAETAENTEISSETESAYTEPETEYFNEMPEEKNEPLTSTETAETEKSTVSTITTTAVTVKVTKPVQANISWTAARVEYSAEGWQGAEFALSAEDAKIIKDYCFGSKYELGTCDCLGDYVFTTENGAQIYYHTDCGVFNDFANERSYKTLDWMRDEINEILSKYYTNIQ